MHPGLGHVWKGWLDCGPPATLFGGLASGMTDQRGSILPGRLAWLDEEGVTDREQRSLYRHLWGVLDTAQIRKMQKALSEAGKRRR